MTDEFLKTIQNTFDANGLQLISEFHLIFARLEYALKSTGYFRNNKGRAEPDWNAFVINIQPHFNPTANDALSNSVKYILKAPPKIQRIQNGQIKWATQTFRANTSEIERLQRHICDVRNNLFHGGKFNGTFAPDVSRNYELLKHSLVILNNWIELDPLVSNHFLEPIMI